MIHVMASIVMRPMLAAPPPAAAHDVAEIA